MTAGEFHGLWDDLVADSPETVVRLEVLCEDQVARARADLDLRVQFEIAEALARAMGQARPGRHRA